MDKVNTYRRLVRQILSEIATSFRTGNKWQILEAFDDEHGQYLLFTDGWEGEIRDYGCFMHIEVKDNGRIWLHRDGTDLNVGEMLLEAAVPKSDIVLGFKSPTMRTFSDFAVS